MSTLLEQATPTCSECDERATARGLCLKHYSRHRRAGTLPPTQWEQRDDIVSSAETFTDANGLTRIVGLPDNLWEIERLVGILEWLSEAYDTSDALVPGEKHDVTIREYVAAWQDRLAALATVESSPGREGGE